MQIVSISRGKKSATRATNTASRPRARGTQQPLRFKDSYGRRWLQLNNHGEARGRCLCCAVVLARDGNRHDAARRWWLRHHRRALEAAPVCSGGLRGKAHVPACGILLPAGTAPVFSLPALVVKETALAGVDAAVHALGGKATAGPMVALVVDAALLDLARTTRRQQDGPSAAAAGCDGAKANPTAHGGVVRANINLRRCPNCLAPVIN